MDELIDDITRFAAVLVCIALAIFGWVGWLWNIAALIGDSHVTGWTLLRAVGIFVWPLGAVLGWL